jgi:cytidine deaminase
MSAGSSQRVGLSELAPELRELIVRATLAREQAHAPYSGFPVGAAILTRAGSVYAGCNVENSSYSATMCAERVALFSAIAAGERDFAAIALVADLAEPLTPCGTCRQVLAELAPTIAIAMANLAGAVHTTTIGELLPAPFSLPEPRQRR